jgi:hypothetical protein
VNGTEYEKQFFIPRHYKVASAHVKSICLAHNLDIASLDTLNEFNFVSSQCKRQQNLVGDYVHIDGIAMSPKSAKDWYWTNSGMRISYEMPWAPKKLDFTQQLEWCLSLGPTGVYKFNDIRCNGENGEERSFICQKVQNLCSERKDQVKF